jgi:hypothetical protein
MMGRVLSLMLEAYSPVPSLDRPTELGGEGFPLLVPGRIPLSMPPSGLLGPYALGGIVGEYGLSPAMFR